LEPTARALELLPRIDALIEMMGLSLRSGLGFDPTATTRQFNIALTDFAAGVIDGAFARELQTTAPRASFALQFFRGFAALTAVRRGRADIAIGRFDTAQQGLKREPFVNDRYCVVARVGHPNIAGRIDEETWRKTGHIFAATNILQEDGVEGPAVGEDAIPSSDVVARAGFVPRWEVAYSMVAGCDAIATGSRRLALQMGKSHGLQVIELPRVEGWTLSLVRRDETDEGLDWLSERLRAVVQSDPA
jgi:DNA-binding transcriptional LysR family regulator